MNQKRKLQKRYNKIDENEKQYREIDLRKTGDADRREDRPDIFYYFYFKESSSEFIVSKEKLDDSNGVEIIPLREDGVEGRWRWGFDTAQKRLDELLVRFMPNREIWGVFERDYLDGRPPVKPTTSWTFKDVNSERGSEQFVELGFEKEVFPRPKPIGTLKKNNRNSDSARRKKSHIGFLCWVRNNSPSGFRFGKQFST